jgi:molybdate transport system regulatory protein
MKRKPRRGTARSRTRPEKRTLHAQIWIESQGGAAVNEAGADLLDQIAACGSLSEAARKLRFSYRRAWMLLDAMNHRWPGPLVLSTTGGRAGGGAKLTELGRHVLRTYRDLQLQLEHLLDTAGDPFEPFP